MDTIIQYTKGILDFCQIDKEMFNVLSIIKTKKFTEIIIVGNKLVLNIDNSDDFKHRIKILAKGFTKNLGVKIAS